MSRYAQLNKLASFLSTSIKAQMPGLGLAIVQSEPNTTLLTGAEVGVATPALAGSVIKYLHNVNNLKNAGFSPEEIFNHKVMYLSEILRKSSLLLAIPLLTYILSARKNNVENNRPANIIPNPFPNYNTQYPIR
jgi:hypothetical protein